MISNLNSIYGLLINTEKKKFLTGYHDSVYQRIMPSFNDLKKCNYLIFLRRKYANIIVV